MPVVETVTTPSISSRRQAGLFDRRRRRFDEQRFGRFEIDGVAVMPAMRLLHTIRAGRRCGAWRSPALSNTPDSRSNRPFRPPKASRASALASDCSITCGGTAVASESKLQGCMHGLIEWIGRSPVMRDRSSIG